MYAVIFRAQINEIDPHYDTTAQKLRQLALDEYGCTEFASIREGNSEITLSYWRRLEDIRRWKQVSEHLAEQELGRKKWYSKYQVQVVQVLRSYESVTNTHDG